MSAPSVDPASPPAPAEESIDHLLTDHGRSAPLPKRILYLLLALPPAALPLLLATRVLHADIASSLLTLAFGSLFAAAMLSIAYHNVAFWKAVRVGRRISLPSRAAFKGKDKSEYEAACRAVNNAVQTAGGAYGLAMSNAIYLVAVLVLAFYVFKGKLPADVNYVASSVGAAALTLLNSQRYMKAV